MHYTQNVMVEWDTANTDGEAPDNYVFIPDEVIEEAIAYAKDAELDQVEGLAYSFEDEFDDFICNWLSDEFGWCVEYFEYIENF